jgi:protocatechuate 3,4-dioxygenase beta subunit
MNDIDEKEIRGHYQTEEPFEEEDDDKAVGRVLSRREMFALLGGAGAAVVGVAGFGMVLGQETTATTTGTAAATGTPAATAGATASALLTQTATALPSCVVRPELTEGPYFVDGQLNRSDIRIEPSDNSVREGAVLRLMFNVSNVTSEACAPLPGAQIDVWHCDALGRYSGVSDPGFDTSNEKWLRGYQVTDDRGNAEFLTIYPGWYSGRTTHIHFKIRTDPDADSGYEFTSQLFFDEALTDIVHAEESYAAKGYRDTLNESDNIFQSSEGLLTLNVIENDAEDGGYIALFSIGLDLTQDSDADSFGRGGRPPGRP